MLSGTDQLRALIAAVRRRWFMTVAFRTAGTAMAAAALPLLCGLLAYWTFAPSGGALLILGAASAATSLAAVWIVLRRVEPRPDDTRVARFIEERVGSMSSARSMDDAIVSAVQASGVSSGDERAPFATLVIGAALRRLEGIDASVVVPGSSIRKAALIGAAGAALLVVTLFAGFPALRHTIETARLQLFPQSITVDVVPGDTRVLAGRPLTIRARLTSDGELLSRAVPKLIVAAGAEQRSVEMSRRVDGFEFGFESIDRTFRYKVEAGGVESREYTVTALFPPRVEQIDVEYRYPSFSRLAPRTEEDGGDIYAPAGTRVRLKIHTDKPIVSGRLDLLKAAPEIRVAGDQILEADLVIARDGSYRISLLDRDGLESSDDSEYFIRVMEDRPPDVRILRPASDQAITPLQEVPIEARADDDYGIASLELVYSVGGGKERVVPFSKVAGGSTQRTGAHLLAAEELDVQPGDVITYYARARDVAYGRRSTESKSDMFFLEVKPFNEEFVAAQSQAGTGANGDPQIDALIQAQKDIISATWNIERRSAGGRSADDVKAIAKAQAELKARVERVLSRGRGRRGRGFMMERQTLQVPDQRQRSQDDPVAAAVAAMTRAIEQLASARTREAIPHEMAALNGLMQAQAEVRRRQVMQQARGAGSGGGNRQSQDLSALFDKELQRQQRTNYEQRSQVEERQDQQQSNQELLDRIRDLARRQEELSRQQRELAQMQAEERKRQLDRLAREQQELQRQTEDLAKQMERSGSQNRQSQQQSGQQQSGQQSGQQQSGQQSQGSAGMRGALEQMRRAANDMRRDDGESAAQSGQRAAEQLRRLEQQMRGGSADARQRAAADLQAEAQQIAQEQRRIAAEAERMEKSGQAADADATRRLAADKDRLSDRVDNLKREAERLGREKGSGDESRRAREAAGALEKGQIGERMREAAQQMRDGVKPSGQAEQQVAKALEQALDKLGGAASEDARKLAEQLDQSRQLRERLDRLEAQLDAKQRQADGRQDGELEKLRQQYERELGRARETLGRQSSGEQRGGRGGTPEQEQFSRSAPGTEAFKQDRSRWESLRRDVDRALEEHDAAVSRRLAKALGEDRLNAGGSERVPEEYRRLIAKYYESLARAKK